MLNGRHAGIVLQLPRQSTARRHHFSHGGRESNLLRFIKKVWVSLERFVVCSGRRWFPPGTLTRKRYELNPWNGPCFKAGNVWEKRLWEVSALLLLWSLLEWLEGNWKLGNFEGAAIYRWLGSEILDSLERHLFCGSCGEAAGCVWMLDLQS